MWFWRLALLQVSGSASSWAAVMTRATAGADSMASLHVWPVASTCWSPSCALRMQNRALQSASARTVTAPGMSGQSVDLVFQEAGQLPGVVAENVVLGRIESDARSYPRTAAWARALHDHAERVDGLLWASGQRDTGRALLPFGARVKASELALAPGAASAHPRRRPGAAGGVPPGYVAGVVHKGDAGYLRLPVTEPAEAGAVVSEFRSRAGKAW